MGANRTPMDKSMTKEKAIKQGGYYNTDGDWNNLITLDDYPGKVFRGRVETLVLKDNKVFMFLKDNGNYRIPGGGFDRGVLNIDQAFIETKEEAKIIVKDLRFTGVTYATLYDELFPYKDGDIPHDGTYNEVYVAKYKEDYTGYIRKGLSDMELTRKGQFYDVSEIESVLREPHRQALMSMLHNDILESGDMDDPDVENDGSSSDLNDLVQLAQKFQKELTRLHDLNLYLCINIMDIQLQEEKGKGILFAQYHTTSAIEVDQVKNFIAWCNEKINIERFNAYVDEPDNYDGYGYLYIKTDYYNKQDDDINIPNTITIRESAIFNKDKVFNIDDFIDGKTNVLLITGLSGSGKTTMANDIANEYNAKVISLDNFQGYSDFVKLGKDYNDAGFKFVKEYMDNNPDIKDVVLSNITIQDYESYFNPFFFWLLEKLKTDKRNTYIVEGIHILLFNKFEDIKGYPLICIETSKAKSMIRHWIRDGWGVTDIIKNGYKDLVLFNEWDKKKRNFFKEAAGEDENNDKYPIFIVNSYTGTPFGKIIKTYTHSVYTHSSISLDTSLEKLYSFNGDNKVNKSGGFSIESLSSYVNYNNDCMIQVNCIFVTKHDLDIIKGRLDYLQKNQKITKYGFDNIFNIIRNKSIEMGKDATSMVCSQFVSYILSVADIKLLDKSINLVTPKDLASLSSPTIYLIYEGFGRDYDKKKIDRIFRKLKIKSHLIKEK